jgi:NADP-dependent 3-hydroxy acid dehydrogenase YdfG
MPGMIDCAGRVAAITGASAGIGAACARAFASAGMSVALLARRRDRLERWWPNHRAGRARPGGGGRRDR